MDNLNGKIIDGDAVEVKYYCKVSNDQGASDSSCAFKTVASAKRWLSQTWSDLRNLDAEVVDNFGGVYASKPMGRVRWL